jgi:transposase
MRPQGSAEQLEHRRLEAIRRMRQGWSNTRISRTLGCTPQSVRRWRRVWRRRGKRALAAKPVSGRPSKLNARQRRSLAIRLTRGALANGFATDLWTCPRIAELVRREFAVHYHVDHIPRLLASLGFSCQKPRRQAAERDEEAIRRWVAVDWPRIKKRPA